MVASSSICSAAVAGEQQERRGAAGRRAILPFQLYDGNSTFDCQIDLFDIECDLDTPPLVWDSDESNDDQLNCALEDHGEPITSSAEVFILDDDDMYSAMPEDSSNFRFYPEELSMEDCLVQEIQCGLVGKSSDIVLLSPIATFSIAESGTDRFFIMLGDPTYTDCPFEVGSDGKPGYLIYGDLGVL
ncbi:hypothetical protein APHAL10511_004707 [Amanita phalloides]|nr:hypothetical protein APHAL10511_004707 [Amanita phalloides]